MVYESDFKKMKIKYMERDIGVLVEMYYFFFFIYINEIVFGG